MKAFIVLLLILPVCLWAQISTSSSLKYTPHPTRVIDLTGHQMTSNARCGLYFIQDSVSTGSTVVGALINIFWNVDTIGVRGTDTAWIAFGNDTTHAVEFTPNITGQLWGVVQSGDTPNPLFIRRKGKARYPGQTIGN